MGNEVQTQGNGRLQEFKRILGMMVERNELALPENVKPEAFRNAAIVAVQDNQKILACDQASLFSSLRELASLGLVPNGREAALVPFKTKDGDRWIDKVEGIPMVAGLIKSARRSGDVKDIRAHLVYEREVEQGNFVYVIGDEERLDHTPILFGDKGPAVGAYAIAKLKDGSLVREFMDRDQIEKVRKSAASQKNFERGKRPTPSEEPKGIWADWQEEMWKKTLIRRICKRLDLSAEDMRVFDADPDYRQAKDVTPQQPTALQDEAPAPSRTADRMKALIDNDADDVTEEGTPHDEDGVVQEDEPEKNDPDPKADPEPKKEEEKEPEQKDEGTEEEYEPTEEEVDEAIARGRDAKEKGMARKAVPGNLRGVPALAKAWQDGWDREAKAMVEAG